MNEYQIAESLDLIWFRTANTGDFEQMSMTVVVEGMPFDHLMIKLKGQDRTWAEGL